MTKSPTWHLEVRDIEELIPHSKNPRYISKEDAKHLKASIAKFGLIDKPIITSDGRVIGGHQRLKVLFEQGHREIECLVSDPDFEWTQENIDELTIRLNKNTGNWDFDILANEWDIDHLCEWGFKPDDFDDPLPKKKKPQVLFEFSDKEELEKFVQQVNQSFDLLNCKMKVRA